MYDQSDTCAALMNLLPIRLAGMMNTHSIVASASDTRSFFRNDASFIPGVVCMKRARSMNTIMKMLRTNQRTLVLKSATINMYAYINDSGRATKGSTLWRFSPHVYLCASKLNVGSVFHP